ncbi:hypothetical protein GCM10022419_108900 [Nonomuraea rosea]|uniref:Uncharacterized protein n=1 Tax=Nonomuraea rosea TaxID=638574 RepID=A0ABP6ZDL3_9ACTN
MLLGNGEGVQQHAQPAAVDETDVGHVENQLISRPLADISDELAQSRGAGQVNLSGQRDHGCPGVMLMMQMKR